jgi:hypothetical protein
MTMIHDVGWFSCVGSRYCLLSQLLSHMEGIVDWVNCWPITRESHPLHAIRSHLKYILSSLDVAS